MEFGRLEPTGTHSDANTTSFYSNNTSNLNNSRYLLDKRNMHKDNQMVLPDKSQINVGKIIPSNMMKSIEGASTGSNAGNY